MNQRSKVWGKQTAPSKRDAQRLADEFMEKVNARNNEPGLYPSDDETLASLVPMCREKTSPHLKNSTRQHYEFFMDKYLLPAAGERRSSERWSSSNFRTSSTRSTRGFRPNRFADARVFACSSKSGEFLLPLATIGKLIGILPEPTKTVVTLIVFGSLRIHEVLALGWRHIHADRITVQEREANLTMLRTTLASALVPNQALS